jgi:hypothetical protein
MKQPSPLDLASAIKDIISDVDQHSALSRVNALREEYPDLSVQELVELLIRRKSRQAGAVGAATSMAALIPGVGTLFALAAGAAADIVLVLRMQAELVLEVAAAHRRLLSEEEKQRALLLVAGLSASGNRLALGAGRKVAAEMGERFAQRGAIRLLPVAGVAASAGLNALATYLVGVRAHAYFSLEPDEMRDWREAARAITGLDERWLKRRLREWSALQSGWRAAQSAGRSLIASARKLARHARRRKRYLELP